MILLNAINPAGTLKQHTVTNLEQARVWAMARRLEGAHEVKGWYLQGSDSTRVGEAIRFHPKDPRYVVYGYREVPAQFRLRARAHRSAIHSEGHLTLEDALAWLADHGAENAGQLVHVVVVQLDSGVDRNGERHVVRRIGEGKAWWE